MTLKLPYNELRLKPGETPTPERLAELFEGIQRNYEAIAALFPIQGSNLGKLPDARLLKPTIVGRVSSAGAVVVGTDFTSKKTGTGAYEVTLATELATDGIMVATSAELNRLIRVSGGAKKTFAVNLVDKGEVAADGAFNFHIKAS